MSASAPARLDSLDFLRGGAMALMALDHVRHFFSSTFAIRPTDLAHGSAALFLTRWVTHFCAPAFVLLAGAGVFLSTTGPGARSKGELSWFLVTRGLWLIVLELTFIRCCGWTFNVDYRYAMGGVMWALGWSMIALAGLIHLRRVTVVAAVGIAMCALHNAFDFLRPRNFGPAGWLWKLLHTTGQLEPIDGVHFKVAYPLIPWIGVMAAGYGLGALLLRPIEERRRLMLRLGAAMTIAFLLLRAANVYGDPRPWSAQATPLLTVLSFINCDKYPPSLLFLLMTLGPALCVVALYDYWPRVFTRWGRPFVTLGRVPLFYYLLHLPLIHGMAVLFSLLRHGRAGWLFENPPAGHGAPFPFPDGYGYGLPVVYAVWIAVVAVLFPVCAWYGRIKRTRHAWWMSYL